MSEEYFHCRSSNPAVISSEVQGNRALILKKQLLARQSSTVLGGPIMGGMFNSTLSIEDPVWSMEIVILFGSPSTSCSSSKSGNNYWFLSRCTITCNHCT